MRDLFRAKKRIACKVAKVWWGQPAKRSQPPTIMSRRSSSPATLSLDPARKSRSVDHLTVRENVASRRLSEGLSGLKAALTTPKQERAREDAENALAPGFSLVGSGVNRLSQALTRAIGSCHIRDLCESPTPGPYGPVTRRTLLGPPALCRWGRLHCC